MALLTSYSSANMVVYEHLAVRYAQRRKEMTRKITAGLTVIEADGTMATYVNNGSKQVKLWVISRTATKDYAFIGMTEAAAKTCAADKVRKYTRSSYAADPDSYSGYIAAVECTANIVVCRHDDDSDAWQVRIQVNEHDERVSPVSIPDPATFMGLDFRDYDDGEATMAANTLKLISAIRYNNTITLITFAHTIEAFQGSNCIIQWRQVTGITWNGNQPLSSGGIVVGEGDTEDQVAALLASTILIRLVYSPGGNASDITSNSITLQPNPPNSGVGWAKLITIIAPTSSGSVEAGE